MQHGLIGDAFSVHIDAVGAAAIGDHQDAVFALFYDRMETGDVRAGKDEIIGVTATDGEHRLCDLQDAALAFRAENEKSRHRALVTYCGDKLPSTCIGLPAS